MSLGSIFKAYDVRGLCPGDFDVQSARTIGAAWARYLADRDFGRQIVLGGDMRPTTSALIEALAEGITAQGSTAVVIGLCATDQLYFASGWQHAPGIMVTASHNPAAYNGMKFCLAGAGGVGLDTGLAEVRDLAAQGLIDVASRGSRRNLDSLGSYVAHLHRLVDISGVRPLKIVVDAANGMAGHTVPAVFNGTNVEIVPLYFELDGTFPNHPADPLNPDNLVDLQEAVVREDADLGLAFDGDADRCFVVDERGGSVSPSAISAMIAARELARVPGAAVVYNVITSQTVPELVTELGGVAVRGKVGHSNMKALMAQSQAIFGGEHSAHYYFRDFWNADTGMLAALHVIAALGEADQPLSALTTKYERYVASGEINSTVLDADGRIAAVRDLARGQSGAHIDELDGVIVQYQDRSRVSVRLSNTEPLLRLNVESPAEVRMIELRDQYLELIRAH